MQSPDPSAVDRMDGPGFEIYVEQIGRQRHAQGIS